MPQTGPRSPTAPANYDQHLKNSPPPSPKLDHGYPCVSDQDTPAELLEHEDVGILIHQCTLGCVWRIHSTCLSQRLWESPELEPLKSVVDRRKGFTHFTFINRY